MAGLHTGSIGLWSVWKKINGAAYIFLSAEEIQAEYAGTGLGRKTIQEITQAVGINPDLATSRLNEANIKAGGGDKLKELTETYELTPLGLLLIMSGKQY
jgi:ABC-type transport system substrate-binding protein